MKDQGYRLMQAIGAVDDDLIEEAAPNAAARKRRRNRQILTVAAGLVIVLLLTLILKPVLAPNPEENPVDQANAAHSEPANSAGEHKSPANAGKDNTAKIPTDITINSVKDTGQAQLDMDITINVLNLNDTAPIDPAAASEFKERTGMAFEDFHARLAGYTIDEVAELNAPTDNGGYAFRDYDVYAAQADTKININFSPFGKPLRDVFYVSDDLMTSTIGDTEVVITRCGESDYWATFTAHNLYFDVTADHITESDFIDLLIAFITD